METEFLNVFYKYIDDIYRLAFSYTHSFDDSNDVVQNVFIKYYKNTSKITLNDLGIKKWLVVTTINECKDLFKSFWKRNVSLLSDDLNNIHYTKTKESLDLLNALKCLKTKYRLIIHLYYYMGFTTKEISKIMRISESSVKVGLLRARAILRKKLEGYDE